MTRIIIVKPAGPWALRPSKADPWICSIRVEMRSPVLDQVVAEGWPRTATRSCSSPWADARASPAAMIAAAPKMMATRSRRRRALRSLDDRHKIRSYKGQSPKGCGGMDRSASHDGAPGSADEGKVAGALPGRALPVLGYAARRPCAGSDGRQVCTPSRRRRRSAKAFRPASRRVAAPGRRPPEPLSMNPILIASPAASAAWRCTRRRWTSCRRGRCASPSSTETGVSAQSMRHSPPCFPKIFTVPG